MNLRCTASALISFYLRILRTGENDFVIPGREISSSEVCGILVIWFSMQLFAEGSRQSMVQKSARNWVTRRFSARDRICQLSSFSLNEISWSHYGLTRSEAGTRHEAASAVGLPADLRHSSYWHPGARRSHCGSSDRPDRSFVCGSQPVVIGGQNLKYAAGSAARQPRRSEHSQRKRLQHRD